MVNIDRRFVSSIFYGFLSSQLPIAQTQQSANQIVARVQNHHVNMMVDRYNKEVEYYKTANIIQYIQQNVYDRDQTETIEQQRRLTEMLQEVEQPPTQDPEEGQDAQDQEENVQDELDTNIVHNFNILYIYRIRIIIESFSN